MKIKSLFFYTLIFLSTQASAMQFLKTSNIAGALRALQHNRTLYTVLLDGKEIATHVPSINIETLNGTISIEHNNEEHEPLSTAPLCIQAPASRCTVYIHKESIDIH